MSRKAAISTRSDIEPFRVMEVLAEARVREAEGADILHLAAGEPAASAPRPALEAARLALSSGKLPYTNANGLPALREAIALHYRDFYGVKIHPRRVVLSMGSSAGIVLAMLACFDAGARVGLASPGYPAYRNIMRALDLEPVEIQTSLEDGFQPTVAQLDATARDGSALDGLMLCSPANPTGSMLNRAQLGELLGWCAAHGAWALSDEIYHGITFEQPAETALAFSEQAIVLNGFSKYYCMTGWRLGWVVVPDRLAPRMEKLAQNLFVAPPTLAQEAALAALGARDELDAHVASYQRNRDRIIETLDTLGVTRIAPCQGAFYVYADISHITEDSTGFCQQLLEDTGIAATPGVDFDSVRGQGAVRFSIAGPEAEIEEACRRLDAWWPQQARQAV